MTFGQKADKNIIFPVLVEIAGVAGRPWVAFRINGIKSRLIADAKAKARDCRISPSTLNEQANITGSHEQHI